MKINRKKLVDQLELVFSVVNTNSFIPEFRFVHFNGKDLHATDGVVAVVTHSPLPENSFCIEGETFLNLLRNLNTEEVELNFKEKSLEVRTEGLEGKFKISKASVFTPVNSSNAVEIADELLESLYLCKFGASKEKTSGAVTGVRIDGDKVFSTDRFRAYQYSLDKPSGVSPSTLPIKFIEIILRKREEIVSYGLTEEIFYAQLSDGTIIQSRTYPGEYPELEKHFLSVKANEENFIELIFEEDLKTVLEKHLRSLLSSIEFYNQEIKVVVENGQCTLYSFSLDDGQSGTLVEKVQLKKEVINNFEFVVNPTLLQQVLDRSKGSFFYDPVGKIILIRASKLQVLIQTKE